MEHTLFVCACGDTRHMLIVTHDQRYDDLYIGVHLDPQASFWRRLKYATQYLLGRQSKYGPFEEMMLTNEERTRLANALAGSNHIEEN